MAPGHCQPPTRRPSRRCWRMLAAGATAQVIQMSCDPALYPPIRSFHNLPVSAILMSSCEGQQTTAHLQSSNTRALRDSKAPPSRLGLVTCQLVSSKSRTDVWLCGQRQRAQDRLISRLISSHLSSRASLSLSHVRLLSRLVRAARAADRAAVRVVRWAFQPALLPAGGPDHGRRHQRARRHHAARPRPRQVGTFILALPLRRLFLVP